jgi:hypothetical protein
MDEDKSVEDSVGVEIEVLDTLIFQKPFEEVARWESQHALHEPREHRDLIRIFSIGYGSPVAARHMSTSFSRRNPLFSSANRSSVLAFDFFPLLVGIRARGRNRRC